MQCAELYRSNGMCHDEKLENFLLLLEASSLTDEASTHSTAAVANLPSNKDVPTSLFQSHSLSTIANSDTKGVTYWYFLKPNQLCAVIWLKEKKSRLSLVYCFCMFEDENCITLDHLCRKKTEMNKWWRYPLQAFDQQVTLNKS